VRGNRRCSLRAALILLLAGSFVALTACGGDDDVSKTVKGTPVSATPSATGAAKKAADLLPKLDSLGFKMTQQGAPSATTSGIDAALAQYERAAPTQMGARVEIRVFPDESVAATQFVTLSEALRNPPPDLFGPNATQTDTSRPGPGDQGKSYVTAKPDGQGNFVWTDAYRFGRAFVIVYSLGKESPETLQVRRSVGELIAAGSR